jgi:predicted negative regulator of RcsB-dependent stress response
MTNQDALALVRQLLKAPNDEELMKIVTLNLTRVDGTFFNVVNQSVEQLRNENKASIADALERLGDKILRMRTLI